MIESKSEDEHDKEARLKEQETALVKLAELYRDQKSVSAATTPDYFGYPDTLG